MDPGSDSPEQQQRLQERFDKLVELVQSLQDSIRRQNEDQEALDLQQQTILRENAVLRAENQELRLRYNEYAARNEELEQENSSLRSENGRIGHNESSSCCCCCSPLRLIRRFCNCLFRGDDAERENIINPGDGV